VAMTAAAETKVAARNLAPRAATGFSAAAG
jgi:hypothetical protein